MTGVLLAVAALFALGGALILLASLTRAGRAVAAPLWPFYRSEFLIVGCFLLPAAAGGWIFLVLLLAMALRGLWEIFALLRQTGRAPVSALVLGLGLFLALMLMGVLRQQLQGFLWLFLAQAVVETNDSFALLLGKLLGRTRPFPRLSPGKTLAGMVGGLTAGLAAGFAIARLLLGLPVFSALAAVATALAAGLAGDLLVSLFKRRVEVKDFPPLALLHGGLLDIYDSLLFAAPALLLLRAVLGL